MQQFSLPMQKGCTYLVWCPYATCKHFNRDVSQSAKIILSANTAHISKYSKINLKVWGHVPGKKNFLITSLEITSH